MRGDVKLKSILQWAIHDLSILGRIVEGWRAPKRHRVKFYGQSSKNNKNKNKEFCIAFNWVFTMRAQFVGPLTMKLVHSPIIHSANLWI